MRRSASVVPRVCLVAACPLAEAYLRELLAKDRMRILNLDQAAKLSPIRQRNTVFVIDRFGLDLPLCECIKRIARRFPAPRFVVLDQSRSTDEVVSLLVMGAHGYVPHDQVLNTLEQAILQVAASRLWVPLEAFQAFLCAANSALRKRHLGAAGTTPREREIVELVSKRLSNREIAELLHIRLSTVKFHVSNVLSKMNMSSRHELMQVSSARMGVLF